MVESSDQNSVKGIPVEPFFCLIFLSLVQIFLISIALLRNLGVDEVNCHCAFYKDVVKDTHNQDAIEDGKWASHSKFGGEVSKQKIDEANTDTGQ